MKPDRETVELVAHWVALEQGRAQPQIRATFDCDLLAELCRVWLAVDSAPEVEVGGADGLSCFIRRMGRKSLPSMQGQTVRLVQLATAKGESNG